jgi:hypothetical protein
VTSQSLTCARILQLTRFKYQPAPRFQFLFRFFPNLL